MSHDHGSDPYMSPEARSSRRIFIGIVILLAIIGFLMYSEHRVHALGLGLWLLLLACPLLHLFMHGGHGSHGADGSHGGHARERIDDRTPQREARDRSKGELP